MPTARSTIDSLQARAQLLRGAAHQLDTTPALDLYRRAGIEVWQGPTPDACRDALLTVRRTVQRAAQDLRDRAKALDDRARQLAAEPTGVGS